MNEGAARACRVDRRLSGLKPKVPRALKRAWQAMTAKERGKLSRRWREARQIRDALANPPPLPVDPATEEAFRAFVENTP